MQDDKADTNFPRACFKARNIILSGPTMPHLKHLPIRNIPNILTMLRIVTVSAMALNPAVLQSFAPVLALSLILFFYWVMDFIDGVVARWLNVCSDFGAGLDLIADRFCDISLSLSVVVHGSNIQIGLAMTFLVARFSPDYVIGRFIDTNSKAYASFVTGLRGPLRALLFRLAQEAIHLTRALFFATALIPGIRIPGIDYAFGILVIGFVVLTSNALQRIARSTTS